MSRLGPLARREFRLLFLARGISFLGSAMAPIALAFAVLDLTGSASDLGIVLAARMVPQLVFLLVGGVWADRLPRHLVMVVSDLVTGGAQAATAALVLTGRPVLVLLAIGAPLPVILVAAVVMGLGIELFGVYWDTALQQHVPERALSRVSSYDALGSFIFIPLGQLAAGPTAEAIGVDETLYLAAGIVTLAVVAMVATPDIRHLRRLDTRENAAHASG